MGSHGIFIISIQVTLSVIGNNDAGHFAIHPKVRISIAHEYQQLHGIVPPANPVLRWDGHFQKVETKWHPSIKSKNEEGFQVRPWKATHPAHGCLHDGVKTALWHVDVRRYLLL